MLKIYICQKCYNFRMISKKSNAVCLHCSGNMKSCSLSYDDFSNMNNNERNKLKEKMKAEYTTT